MALHTTMHVRSGLCIPMFSVLLMFIFPTYCKGQNKTEPPKDNAGSETKDVITFHGPNRITRTIMQDKKGNIWIAAFDGIFRYDGKTFTHITSKVSAARFFSVLEDRKGNFWFASLGSGVYYYDGSSFQNFTTKDGLAHDAVHDIYEDKTGNIWFGTRSGASCYDGKSFRNFTNNDINSIIEDKAGKFWFGTRGDACVYNGTSIILMKKDGKPFTNVRSIIEDKKGNI
ncbi:MAG TPA: two-component regulator propeller domain-containing protein [Cytophagales bacterium]|nr:two-component regulator propeller domain-containing protein [Cytophagales bacterium]